MPFKMTDSKSFRGPSNEQIVHEVSDQMSGFMHRLSVYENGKWMKGEAVPYHSIACCGEWKAACAFWEGTFISEHPFRIVYADKDE